MPMPPLNTYPKGPAAAQAKRHEVAGLLVGALAVLLGMALGSYRADGGPDWCGPGGALVAEALLGLLGSAAAALPVLLGALSLRLFRRSERPVPFLGTLGTAAIVVSVATALHLWFGERPLLGGLAGGGLLGSTLAETLRAFLGTAGAHTVVLTALLVALLVRTRLSLVGVARGAHRAGLKGGVRVRDGVSQVTRAWKEAREAEKKARPAPSREAPPESPEVATDRALAPLLSHREPLDVGRDPDAFAALMEPGPIPSEKPPTVVATPVPPRRRRRSPVTTDTDTPLPPEPSVVLDVPSDPPEPVVATAAPVGSEPPLEEPQALTIVSHDQEIAQAMKASPGGARTERPPAATPAAAKVKLPSTELLTAPPRERVELDEGQLRGIADKLVQTLADYQIEGRVVEVHPGPVVTTYEVVPAAGTKLSKISRLSDDIAMSLEASRVRIVAPIPGKGRVGFEVPNAQRQTVYFRELVETEAFARQGGALPVALGKDVVGAPYFADLAAMPHLIVAGATGAGKSVGLNVMLASLLYKRTPEDVRMLMIDPKMVELAVFDDIPHMLLPVVTDMKKATLALRWVVDEMERRYSLFAQVGARNIVTYNERIARALAEGTSVKGLDGPVRTKESGTTESVSEADPEAPRRETPKPKRLPYIVVVVDEFADLIMVAGKDIEAAVARLAQKARAAGIHVILATQRPSVDVITGMIKANFPARVAFKVSQRVDSRTILDQQGAENLLGRGDMLILPPGSSDLRRVHCAFISEEEVQRVTDHWRAQGRPTFDQDILKPREEEEPDADGPAEVKVPQDKYDKAVQLVSASRKCSVSYVQRYLGIGYNVAARIVDKMEREGVVGAPKGPGKDREVLL
ncbi:MAG: DNA translocase FtsK 4TM domain-containing protein [Deltaproteobacteria bacterium]|nr:DNA translocase FtsK 4TM domain-containing protein [Deltaproteobacteria bacterium]